MKELVSVLPLLLLGLLFWVMIIRPQMRRQREVSKLQAALSPGDRVMLTSGIFGEITEIADDRVHVQVAPGVTLQVVRGAIASIDQESLAARTEPTASPTHEAQED